MYYVLAISIQDTVDGLVSALERRLPFEPLQLSANSFGNALKYEFKPRAFEILTRNTLKYKGQLDTGSSLEKRDMFQYQRALYYSKKTLAELKVAVKDSFESVQRVHSFSKRYAYF